MDILNLYKNFQQILSIFRIFSFTIEILAGQLNKFYKDFSSSMRTFKLIFRSAIKKYIYPEILV